MTKETVIPVFHVRQNQDVELYRGKVREDKVYLKEQRVVQFTNSGVFTVIDQRGKRHKRFKAVFYVDGKSKCSEVKSKEEIINTAIADLNPLAEKENPGVKDLIQNRLEHLLGNAYSIFEPLTDQDRKTVVKREIAKQLGKFKPIETWQFILILVMLGVIIALNFVPGI